MVPLVVISGMFSAGIFTSGHVNVQDSGVLHVIGYVVFSSYSLVRVVYTISLNQYFLLAFLLCH